MSDETPERADAHTDDACAHDARSREAIFLCIHRDDALIFVNAEGIPRAFTPRPDMRYSGVMASSPPTLFRRFGASSDRLMGAAFVPTSFGLNAPLADLTEEVRPRRDRA